MNGRVILPVTMELCSDAVFGSGYSIPGGEDVAVCRDEGGWPYVKGSTWKGLLRESLENLVNWGEGTLADAEALFGEAGWTGLTGGRRVQLTALLLENPPDNPEDCFDLRTFTSLENGVVKGGTLRTASCARAGLVFSGELTCASGDIPLLRNALSGIKWAGTQRSRGFGRVRFTVGKPRPVAETAPAATGTCFRFLLHTELPVILTDPNRSDSNSAETYGFIPGAAIRGAVMEALSTQDPEWFFAHKAAALNAQFLDAVPVPDSSLIPLPSLRGFYEDKDETQLENVVKDGNFTPGHKRAKLGAFCAPAGETLRYWSAKTGGVTRIRRAKDGEDTEMFQIRFLSAGQDLEGYILTDDPAIGEKLSQALGKTIWLGADRYAGYGKCTVTLVEPISQPAWQDAYGYREEDEPGEKLYLLAISPFSMVSGTGEPCGVDESVLARKLGVERVGIRCCATALTQSGGYNRMWQCRAPSTRFYDRGSLFRLKCTPAPAFSALRRVQAEGLGIRRAEGFGQVLFLPPALVENLSQKAGLETDAPGDAGAGLQAELRRARYRWVMEYSKALNTCGLSKSQVGTIQALCEKAMANSGDCTELYTHLQHNLTGRGVIHGARFQAADMLIRGTLEQPLGATLGLRNCPDGPVQRLELLCLLFNHSRKGKEGD